MNAGFLVCGKLAEMSFPCCNMAAEDLKMSQNFKDVSESRSNCTRNGDDFKENKGILGLHHKRMFQFVKLQ